MMILICGKCGEHYGCKKVTGDVTKVEVYDDTGNLLYEEDVKTGKVTGYYGGEKIVEFDKNKGIPDGVTWLKFYEDEKPSVPLSRWLAKRKNVVEWLKKTYDVKDVVMERDVIRSKDTFVGWVTGKFTEYDDKNSLFKLKRNVVKNGELISRYVFYLSNIDVKENKIDESCANCKKHMMVKK